MGKRRHIKIKRGISNQVEPEVRPKVNKIFTPAMNSAITIFFFLLIFTLHLRFDIIPTHIGSTNVLEITPPQDNNELQGVLNETQPNQETETESNIEPPVFQNITEPEVVIEVPQELQKVPVPESKIKEDPTYDVVIDSQDVVGNDLVIVFHHDSTRTLPIFIVGDVNYELDRLNSTADEKVTLKIKDWNDQYFRLVVGTATEILQFGKQKKVSLSTSIKDATGKALDSNITITDSMTGEAVYSNSGKSHSTSVGKGKYRINVNPSNSKISSIEFEDVQLNENISKFVNIDDPEDNQGHIELYAIDPTGLNFTRAKVTITGNTEANSLYKCKDWNFTTRTCYGNWVFLKQIKPGQSYDFYLTPEDPALYTDHSGFFGEGFESGLFTTNGWSNTSIGSTNNGEKWLITATSPLTQTRSAIASGSSFTAYLYNNISTEGWKNISIFFTYSRTASATLSASWWNGTKWTVMKNGTGVQAEIKFKFNLTGKPVAENQTALRFRVRFICALGTGIRNCMVDDVNITGLVAIYPKISAKNSSGPTTTTVKINWTTDRPSNTSVNYGTTKSLGTISATNDAVTAHTRSLSSLTKATLYYYNISSCYFNNCMVNGTFNFTTRGVRILNVNYSAIKSTSVMINWTTNIISNTSVKYGTTKSLGSSSLLNNLVTAHNRSIASLSSGTLYFFNLTSCRLTDCQINGTFNFTTRNLTKIMNINYSGITSSTAVINWTTNTMSNTTVNYGTTKSLGTFRRINNAVNLHNVTLITLSETTRYFFNVTSCGPDNCQTNGTRNFTTHSAADVIKPLVFDKYPRNGTVYNVTNRVRISVNVTDDTAVSKVFANITRPGLGLTRLQLILGTANRYNNTFVIANFTGLYNITFEANDTSNNRNTTVRTQFRANDRTVPVIQTANATPNPALPTQRVNFTANVTDNIAVDKVKFTFRGANISMRKAGSTIRYYNDTVNISGIYAGTYKFDVYANDTSGNRAVKRSNNLTITAVTSIQLFRAPINFSSGISGATLNATSLFGFPLFVKNSGNLNISLNVSGTNLSGNINQQKIKVDRVEWDNLSTFPHMKALNYSHKSIISVLIPSKNVSLFFRIRIPTGVRTQAYFGNVTFTAKS